MMRGFIPLLLLTMAIAGLCQGAITKTGDTLTLSATQLSNKDLNKVVDDPAAPGGTAVETAGKAGRLVSVYLPAQPAGQYRVTILAKIGKRVSPLVFADVTACSQTQSPAHGAQRTFAVEDFAKEGAYQAFTLDLRCPPYKEGKFSPYIIISQNKLDVPFRVASIELKALEISPVFISQVWPGKILARTREDQPITVSVHNLTNTPQNNLTLSLELQRDLDTKITLPLTTFSLQPYESKEVPVTWNTGDREYGYEVRAAVSDTQGVVLSSLSDYFAVTRSLYKMRIGAATGAYMLDIRSVPDAVFRSRRSYANYMEMYGWAPSAFAELYPRHRFWSSGQISEWTYDRDVLKTWLSEMHKAGMYAFAYDISLYNGWAGQELMRQHPEWCTFTADGRMDAGVDASRWQYEENAYGDEKPPIKTPFAGEMPNSGTVWPADDKLMARGANEIVLIHKELGFDGVRWDGHPIIWTQEGTGGVIGTGLGKMIYNHEGKTIFQVAPDKDKQSLHNIQLIKNTLRKEDPNFEWGYNAGYDMTCETMPLTWKEVVNNAGIWVEGGFRSGDEGRADPSNTWAKYQNKLYLSSQFVIRGGGYPIHGAISADAAYVRKFLYALFLANGSHPCITGDLTILTDYAKFATRYSQYIYDPNIHPWWGYPDIHTTGWLQYEDRNAAKISPIATEAKVESTRPVWFEKTLFHREISKTEQDTIVHLFNDPGKPYIDYQQMDPPAVQQNVAVTVKAPAGMRLAQAWCLSPDGEPMSKMLSPLPAGDGWIKVTVPQLAIWDIVVFHWEKE
ncbi:MAG TPA: hypothetical protein VGM23_12725 [Armatimonadota bacterium]|jgi:hypothetical protein